MHPSLCQALCQSLGRHRHEEDMVLALKEPTVLVGSLLSHSKILKRGRGPGTTQAHVPVRSGQGGGD